jgi:hypothetical protein
MTNAELYYKKLDHIPAIPKKLCRKLINHVQQMIESNIAPLGYYGKYNTENIDKLTYVKPGTPQILFSCGVGIYEIPKPLHDQLRTFLETCDEPLINYKFLFLQVLYGGKYLGPHLDPKEKKPGFIYLLKAGGSNVKTIYYKVKAEFQNLEYNEEDVYTGIDFNKVEQIFECQLEENKWQCINYNEIHAVINIEDIRIAIYGMN